MRENYEEILSRLKKVLSAKSDADVARGLNVSTAALSAFKKQGKFPYERLINFCLARSISIDWLITGKESLETKKANLHTIAEPGAAYTIRDAQMNEIVELLKEHPGDKKLVLKLLKGKKDIKEALEGFGVKGLVEEG